jgi:transposase
MKKIVKQVVGIDVAQKELVVCLGKMHDDQKPELYAFKSFANTAKGIKTFVEWVNKLTDVALPVRYVMEATGVYHETLAYFLDEHNFEVTVVLPNKISNYVRTLEIKTVTDKTASEAIARFGLERHLDQWHRPKKVFKTLRQLTRERDQVVHIRSMIKNQLHAELAGAEPNKGSTDRIKKQILFFDKQEKEIKKELFEVVKMDEKLKASVELICTIPGIGMLTAVTVLAETNDFELIRNKRQLTSYAGLDVKEKQSGTSVKGKPRISKKGNRYLRKAMHLPALSAIKSDVRFKAVFARLVGKHGIKMKAVVAVQRKLLEMIYIIYKAQKPYDKKYLQKNEAEIMNVETV